MQTYFITLGIVNIVIPFVYWTILNLIRFTKRVKIPRFKKVVSAIVVFTIAAFINFLFAYFLSDNFLNSRNGLVLFSFMIALSTLLLIVLFFLIPFLLNRHQEKLKAQKLLREKAESQEEIKHLEMRVHALHEEIVKEVVKVKRHQSETNMRSLNERKNKALTLIFKTYRQIPLHHELVEEELENLIKKLLQTKVSMWDKIKIEIKPKEGKND